MFLLLIFRYLIEKYIQSKMMKKEREKINLYHLYIKKATNTHDEYKILIR